MAYQHHEEEIGACLRRPCFAASGSYIEAKSKAEVREQTSSVNAKEAAMEVYSDEWGARPDRSALFLSSSTAGASRKGAGNKVSVRS